MGGTPKGHLIYGVGFSNGKYPITINGKKMKEYETWRGILKKITNHFQDEDDDVTEFHIANVYC